MLRWIDGSKPIDISPLRAFTASTKHRMSIGARNPHDIESSPTSDYFLFSLTLPIAAQKLITRCRVPLLG